MTAGQLMKDPDQKDLDDIIELVKVSGMFGEELELVCGYRDALKLRKLEADYQGYAEEGQQDGTCNTREILSF